VRGAAALRSDEAGRPAAADARHVARAAVLRLHEHDRLPDRAAADDRLVSRAPRGTGMKICFFNRSYWPDQAATGQLLTELAEDLVARHGCEVTVVAGRALHAADDDRRRRAALERETRNGVAILRANGTRFRPRRFAGRAANYLTYF